MNLGKGLHEWVIAANLLDLARPATYENAECSIIILYVAKALALCSVPSGQV